MALRWGEEHEKTPIAGSEQLPAQGAACSARSVPGVDLWVGNAHRHLHLQMPVLMENLAEIAQTPRLKLLLEVERELHHPLQPLSFVFRQKPLGLVCQHRG